MGRRNSPTALRQLKAVYPEWKEALAGKHKPIWSRLVTAWHDYVYFRCVTCAFAKAAKTDTQKRLPYGLINAYHSSFYRAQMVELRSAIGGDRGTLHEKNAEISMRAILRSMAETSILRGQLFELNETDYEYEDKRLLSEMEIKNAFSTTGFGVVPSTYASWRFSRDLHVFIDQLTGKTESTRSKDDQIPAQLFVKAEKSLKRRTQKLLLFVNKHVAHAATSESIARESRRVPRRIVAEDLERTFGALSGTYDMLASDLFGWGHYSFNLDISPKLSGVEHAFGLGVDKAKLQITYRKLNDRFDRRLRMWRPLKSAIISPLT